LTATMHGRGKRPMFETVAGLAILIVVLVGVIWRPKGIHVFIPAGLGALLALGLGLVGLPALMTIFGRVWDASFTLIGLFMLAAALETNHFFEWAALRLARIAGGNPWRLYLLMCLLTIVVTVCLGNDGAILGMTAIVVKLVKKTFPKTIDQSTLSGEPAVQVSKLMQETFPNTVGEPTLSEEQAVQIVKPVKKTLPETGNILLMPISKSRSNGQYVEKTLSKVEKTLPKAEHIWWPYIFATGFLADAFSGFLVPDNLTNIIVASTYHLPFIDFMLQMSLPMVFAATIAIFFFALRFRSVLFSGEVRYDPADLGEPASVLRDMLIFRVSCGALFVLIAGHLVIGGVFHQPVSFVVVPVALIVLVFMHFRRIRFIREILFAAPWDVLVYALGMFVVITAAMTPSVIASFLSIAPLHTLITGGRSVVGVFVTGGILGVLSALTNNLPATLAGVLLLGTTKTPSMLAIYAIVLGVDVGPKLTPYGSLATLMWMSILRRQGVEISWGLCFKENWWVAVFALGAALFGLQLLMMAGWV
jgi:Na+/H+ antiporter NhaD/arsenite permease-like protein